MALRSKAKVKSLFKQAKRRYYVNIAVNYKSDLNTYFRYANKKNKKGKMASAH